MLHDLIENPSHVEYAKIWAIGIIVQGLYKYMNTGELQFNYFLLYLCTGCITLLLYYKIFTK